MHIMNKYLFCNELAMKFNWAGREKNLSKELKYAKLYLVKIILIFQSNLKYIYYLFYVDAVHLQFSSETDELIGQAVKDWLKLAKTRFIYEKANVHKDSS